LNEYKKHVEKTPPCAALPDRAGERTSVDDTVAIVRGLKEKFEFTTACALRIRHHRGRFALASLHCRRFLPTGDRSD